MREKLIVALDIADRALLEEKLALLQDHISWVKVGMELFYASGPEIVTYLAEKGFKVFLDLKLHDIPNTVKKAASVLARLGARIINIHTFGGYEMMRQTAEAIKDRALTAGVEAPKVIGVTILTSLSQQAIREELKINNSMADEVLHLACLAQKAGLDGVVTSPWEIREIKEVCGEDFLTVVPGIRPRWAAPGDQARHMTPGQAVKEGADLLVIGRPILGAPDPVAAVNKIIQEMEEVK